MVTWMMLLAIYRKMGDQETTEIVREDEKYKTELERACGGEKMDQGGIRKILGCR